MDAAHNQRGIPAVNATTVRFSDRWKASSGEHKRAGICKVYASRDDLEANKPSGIMRKQRKQRTVANTVQRAPRNSKPTYAELLSKYGVTGAD